MTVKAFDDVSPSIAISAVLNAQAQKNNLHDADSLAKVLKKSKGTSSFFKGYSAEDISTVIDFSEVLDNVHSHKDLTAVLLKEFNLED